LVNLGFIVEGHTEKILIESSRFGEWLNQQGLMLVKPVIDAKGGGNLLPKYLAPMVARLNSANADYIIILTDLEDEVNIATVKQRISNEYTQLIFVAVKAIEAWFLADSKAMNKWLRIDEFYEEKPEETVGLPWDKLNEVAKLFNQRGTGKSKPAFAKQMVKHYDFEVINAAEHINCPSAKAFCDGLMALVKEVNHAN